MIIGVIFFIVSIVFAMNSGSVLEGFLGVIVPIALISINFFYEMRKKSEKD